MLPKGGFSVISRGVWAALTKGMYAEQYLQQGILGSPPAQGGTAKPENVLGQSPSALCPVDHMVQVTERQRVNLGHLATMVPSQVWPMLLRASHSSNWLPAQLKGRVDRTQEGSCTELMNA